PASRKKTTTLPSLFAYAGMPYQVLGVRPGAVSFTIAWIFLPSARSLGVISASAASIASFPWAAAFSSRARARIAAFSSALKLSFLVGLILLLSFVRQPARNGRAAAATC